MIIRTSGSRIRLSGKISSGRPASLPQQAIGQIFRVVNTEGTTDSLTYTTINGSSTSTGDITSGSITYILALSGSIADFPAGTNSINLTVTNLLITSSNPNDIVTNFTESIITTTGTGNWTKPAGVTQVIVECWGAGGAGGGATINQSGGGGGSGGYYSRKLLFYPSAQQTIPYTVGAGGVGGTGVGGDGGSTSFDDASFPAQVNAAGGVGGQPNGTEISPAAGGTNFIFGSIGDVVYVSSEGGNGEYIGPTINQAFGGRGGGGAGSATSATSIDVSAKEYGGVNTNINIISTSGANGLPANNYGGGGSGAAKVSGTNRSGANGAQGLIRLIYR